MSFVYGPKLRVCYDQGDAVVLDLERNLYATLPHASRQKPDEIAPLLAQRAGGQHALEERRRPLANAAIEILRRPVVSLSGRDWRHLLAACAVARLDLASGRLDATFARFAERHERSTTPRVQLAGQIETFVAMRPWWPRTRKCLFDAIALAEFLHRRDVATELVFGVRARPFAAHCWLERSGVILNDSVERVRSYTPIAWS